MRWCLRIGLAWIALGTAAASAQDCDLFLPAPDGAGAPQGMPFVLRARAAGIDFDRLATVRDAGAGPLTLNLFPDLTLAADVTLVESGAPGRYVLSGVISRTLGGNFTIAVVDDAVWADIQLPGRAAFRVRMLPDGTPAVEEVAHPQIDSCAGVAIPGPGTPDGDINQPYHPRTLCPEPDGRFDIAIFWTPAAEAAAGGESAIRAIIASAESRANQAYGNSSVSTRMRVVYTARTPYTEATDGSGNADMQTDLARLTDCCDGFMDEAHARRNAFAADFVHVVSATGTGLAWLYTPAEPNFSGKAFSIGKWDRVSTTWTLAHEVGHNMGCNHNEADAGNPPGGWFPYSLGWYWNGNSGTQWGSVMSYVGTRVAQFSNPDVNFDGQPTGSRVFGVLMAANAQTLNFTDQASANWRNPVYCQKGYVGPQSGCEPTPWDSLAQAVNNVNSGGAIILKPGSGLETGSFSTPCTLRAVGGNATIGR